MKSKEQKGKKAQTWSVDLIIGVVIFLLLIVIIYSLIVSSPQNENKLRTEADTIYNKLEAQRNPESSLPTFIKGNTLSLEDLALLSDEAQYTYEKIKAELGIAGDFCIVLVDRYGGIMNVSSERTAIGSGSDLTIGYDESGTPILCGQ